MKVGKNMALEITPSPSGYLIITINEILININSAVIIS